MAIHFDAEQMKKALENHTKWWEGTLDRPLVSVVLDNAYPVRPMRVPVLAQDNCADFQWTPEQLIDAIDNDLSGKEFLGDAYPSVNFAFFGPGALAAFCGARLDNSTGGVWFFPAKEQEIEDIHVKYDPNSVYARRIKDIYRAGMEKWQGSVIMSIPDLGGVLDVAATLRGSENLLYDLYDAPEEVVRLAREIQAAWYEAYKDLSEVLRDQPGNTNWSGLLSATPSYIIQCDFCYMISNPMFREFVLDTLKEDVKRLDHVIYHLDGIGELKHLDDILSIKELRAVQWVPGEGHPYGAYWMEEYKKIQAAGKNSWICGDPKDYLAVLDGIHGTPYFTYSLDASKKALAKKLIQAR